MNVAKGILFFSSVMTLDSKLMHPEDKEKMEVFYISQHLSQMLNSGPKSAHVEAGGSFLLKKKKKPNYRLIFQSFRKRASGSIICLVIRLRKGRGGGWGRWERRDTEREEGREEEERGREIQKKCRRNKTEKRKLSVKRQDDRNTGHCTCICKCMLFFSVVHMPVCIPLLSDTVKSPLNM